MFDPENIKVRQTLVQVEIQLERQRLLELKQQDLIDVQLMIEQVIEAIGQASLEELPGLKEACTQALGKLPAGSAEEVRSEVLALRDRISVREEVLRTEMAEARALDSLKEVRQHMAQQALTDAEITLAHIEDILPQHEQVREVRRELIVLFDQEQEAARAQNGRELIQSAQSAFADGTPNNAIGLVDAV